MGKVVVTSGARYADIDVLACAIAYSELLRSEGTDAIAVFPGPFNKSITNEIKSWPMEYLTSCPKDVGAYVCVDMSDYKYFAKFVDKDRVIQIFDHHFGFEDYWREKIGDKAVIEHVGSCATLIWEEYEKRAKSKISEISANLLATAIVSNTLNFKASITNKRDKKAFAELQKHTSLSGGWIEKYFEDQSNLVYANPEKEIRNDSNLYMLESFGEVVIGQIELWEGKEFIDKYKEEIEKALLSIGNRPWLITVPSVNEGRNYLYTKNSDFKKVLEEKIGAKFNGDVGVTKKLWLRKEILREIQ